MSARWVIGEGNMDWDRLPDELKDLPQLNSTIKRGFYLKENPTQVGASSKKPVYEVETINGVVVYLVPCAQPGQPLPINRKMNLRIEHLFKEDRRKLEILYEYDADFYMQTNNYRLKTVSDPGEGERYRVKILEFSDEQVAIRFGRQVYTVSMTVRLLK
jgi:hypothetical protein